MKIPAFIHRKNKKSNFYTDQRTGKFIHKSNVEAYIKDILTSREQKHLIILNKRWDLK